MIMFGRVNDNVPEKDMIENAARYQVTSGTIQDINDLDVLDTYKLDTGAVIYITKNGRYLVQEPVVTPEASELYGLIMNKITLSFNLDAYETKHDDANVIAGLLYDAFWDTASRIKRLDDAKRLFPNLKYFIKRNLVGYGIIDALMQDPNIEDILCSAPKNPIRIVHKEYSGMFHSLETNLSFQTTEQTEEFIQRMYGRTGTEPTESKPMSVTYLNDGSRISSTFGHQISKHGPAIAIRKFPVEPFTITHMLKERTLTAEMAAYLWTLLDGKAVGLVLGVTGSGKTTLLAAMISMINPRWRILTIEDTLELRIPHQDWVRLNTRKSYGMLSDRFDISIRDLIDISLTQKPDYEIIGEIRVRDMDVLFQSVGTGHGGLTSFHASTPMGAITRMRGSGISDGELGLLWFTTHSARIRRGNRYFRKVTDISEIVTSAKDGKLEIKNIFRYDIISDKFERVVELGATERYQEAIAINGVDDPKKDMQERITLLNECVKNDAVHVSQVFDILGKYYMNKR